MAALFNGVDARLDAPSSGYSTFGSYRFLDSAFKMIGFWFKPYSNSGSQCMFSLGDGSSAFDLLSVELSGTSLVCRSRGFTGTESTITIANGFVLNQWNHVTACWQFASPRNMALAVRVPNGTITTTSGTGSQSHSAFARLCVGARRGSNTLIDRYYNGLISNVVGFGANTAIIEVFSRMLSDGLSPYEGYWGGLYNNLDLPLTKRRQNRQYKMLDNYRWTEFGTVRYVDDHPPTRRHRYNSDVADLSGLANGRRYAVVVE